MRAGMARRVRADQAGGNLGHVALRRRSRCADPMAAFDALPRPLRAWLAAAALPWSPASCLRLWSRLRARGASEPEALAALTAAELRALERELKTRG
ncbi:hypothetical protein SAMN05660710_00298 [Paracoccus tibetensis]|uniref:Uncharacterized protein n=2 Tax=Paracoccus tibetensis TaxID=336292 RepID=A0A1G5BW27_9RHOB|nr:hypothetical protein SAMN05660710_00298 [Paracoccus tibetensis]